jgi:hypothetical protein
MSDYVRTIDGNISWNKKFAGVVYCDNDGKPDDTARFTRWEDWVARHRKVRKGTSRAAQGEHSAA